MQNVNLYVRETAASAGPTRRQMWGLAAAVLAACALHAAVTVFQMWQGADRLRQAEQAALLAEQQLAEQRAAFREPVLDAQLPRDLAEQQVANQQLQRTLDYLKMLSAQQSAGFVAPLQALSERHPPDGLWLNRIELLNGGESLRLQGYVQDQELLPLYLHSLGQSEVFRGREFARFDVRRNPEGLLTFTLSSTGESADE